MWWSKKKAEPAAQGNLLEGMKSMRRRQSLRKMVEEYWVKHGKKGKFEEALKGNDGAGAFFEMVDLLVHEEMYKGYLKDCVQEYLPELSPEEQVALVYSALQMIISYQEKYEGIKK